MYEQSINPWIRFIHQSTHRAVAGEAAFDAAVRAVHPAVLEQMQRAEGAGEMAPG